MNTSAKISIFIILLSFLLASCVYEYVQDPRDTLYSSDVTTAPTPEVTTRVPDVTTVPTPEVTTKIPEETTRQLTRDELIAKTRPQFKKLPQGDTVIGQFRITLSRYDLVICESEREKYSLYIIDSAGPEEEKVYTKLTLSIPEDIEYDEYKVLPIGGGGAGSEEVYTIVEFTSAGEKRYYYCIAYFCEDPNKWGIFSPAWELDDEQLKHYEETAKKFNKLNEGDLK